MLKKVMVFLSSWSALFFPLLTFSATTPNQTPTVPNFFHNIYYGLDIGYGSFDYNNHNLTPPYTANYFDQTQGGAFNVFMGKKFNSYFSLQLAYERSIQWPRAVGIEVGNGRTLNETLWPNMVDLSLKPSLPLSSHLSLYGLLSGVYFSTSGDENDNLIIKNNGVTGGLGAGLDYALRVNWHLIAETNYVLANGYIPPNFFAGLGFYYVPFTKTEFSAQKPAYFPKNMLSISGMDTNFLNTTSIHSAISNAYLFFGGDVYLQKGLEATFEHDIYHTSQHFSLYTGLNVGEFVSQINQQSFTTLSLMLFDFKFWLLHTHYLDFYLNGSIANPTYISQSKIDNMNTGGNFTFYDSLGVGFLLGSKKSVNLGLQIAHFSNGNLLPNNPGIDIPAMLTLGYTF